MRPWVAALRAHPRGGNFPLLQSNKAKLLRCVVGLPVPLWGSTHSEGWLLGGWGSAAALRGGLRSPLPFSVLSPQRQLGAGPLPAPHNGTDKGRARRIPFVIQRGAGAPLAQLLPGTPVGSGGGGGGVPQFPKSRGWESWRGGGLVGWAVPPTAAVCVPRVGKPGLHPRELGGPRRRPPRSPTSRFCSPSPCFPAWQRL